MAKTKTAGFIIAIALLVCSCSTQTNKTAMIVEITTYKAAENVSHEAILEASKAFDRDYCSRCKSLVRRQFLKTEEGYMDIFLWQSRADVERVQKTFMQDPDALKFANMIDAGSLTMTNYQVIEQTDFTP